MEPSPASRLALHEIAQLPINAATLYLFFATVQVAHQTANQRAGNPLPDPIISHILPDGRRRGVLAMVNRESHPSGRIPERAALPPDETNRCLP